MIGAEQLALDIYHQVPTDRTPREYYLSHLAKIKELGKFEFLLANLRNFEQGYNLGLFLTLPEIWEDFTVDDWVELLENVGDRPRKIQTKDITIGIFADVVFLCKYLEVDGIALYVNHTKQTPANKEAVLRYAKALGVFFTKSPLDVDELSGAFDEEQAEDFSGCNAEKLITVRERLLKDARVSEFPKLEAEAERYLDSLPRHAMHTLPLTSTMIRV